MLILANDVEKLEEMLLEAGPYATLAVASAAVLFLAHLSRAVENYVRYLHKKPYLPFTSPRFLVMTAGFIAVADGALVALVFESRLPLETGWVAITAGIVLLLASAAMSVVPYIREVRKIRDGDNGNE